MGGGAAAAPAASGVAVRRQRAPLAVGVLGDRDRPVRADHDVPPSSAARTEGRRRDGAGACRSSAPGRRCRGRRRAGPRPAGRRGRPACRAGTASGAATPRPDAGPSPWRRTRWPGSSSASPRRRRVPWPGRPAPRRRRRQPASRRGPTGTGPPPRSADSRAASTSATERAASAAEFSGLPVLGDGAHQLAHRGREAVDEPGARAAARACRLRRRRARAGRSRAARCPAGPGRCRAPRTGQPGSEETTLPAIRRSAVAPRPWPATASPTTGCGPRRAARAPGSRRPARRRPARRRRRRARCG